MADGDEFRAPQISDADVSWACEVLNLPPSAFRGQDGEDPRLSVLKSLDSLDIEACPGSGKTTLLVAKLAILARRWSDSRRGICVLSHTNVARRSIEEKLGNSVAGERLLSYPHFVGTIHSFVNEFLALPWLRSRGYPIRVVDTELCIEHRHRLLRLNQFQSLANWVRSRMGNGRPDPVAKWRVWSSEFEVRKDDGKLEFKDQSGASARQLVALARQCALDGYYRHDEMFTWALDMIESVPSASQWLRDRFPLVFIDEVQDNSEEQSTILFKVFMEGERASVRQRFGDSNQAIYQYTGQEGASTDLFPEPARRQDIPNSHRFAQGIADLANPLGLVPQSLAGCGPGPRISSIADHQHAVFLFREANARWVLPAYGRYLCEVFTAKDLEQGSFVAVGGVHREVGDDRIPKSVGHYWHEYDHELSRADPSPKTFFQFVMMGRTRTVASGEAWHLVESIAAGVLKLARLADPTAELGSRKRRHRQVMELLAERPEERASYQELVAFLGSELAIPSAEAWESRWMRQLEEIAGSLCNQWKGGERTREFLEWGCTDSGDDLEAPSTIHRENVFHYTSPNDANVRIRVGSIHSVKGETHTATLVLETYFHEFQLEALKPWLLGDCIGKGTAKKRKQSRLKQHYVAMTRPSHLLCLALREDSVSADEIGRLQSRGWRVARVDEHGDDWLSSLLVVRVGDSLDS